MGNLENGNIKTDSLESISRKNFVGENSSTEIGDTLIKNDKLLEMIGKIKNEEYRDELEEWLKNNCVIEKEDLFEMIGKIEDEEIKKTLEQGLRYNSPEQVLYEMAIYYVIVDSKLEEHESYNLYNMYLRNRNLLPSQLIGEFEANETIIGEEDVEIRGLMELSYTRLLPSKILEDRELYQEFASITDPEEKEVIRRCLKIYGLSAPVIKAYQLSSYSEIKSIPDENVRKMMLLYVHKGFLPSVTQDYQVYFEDIAEAGIDCVNKSLEDIKKLDGSEPHETIAYVCTINTQICKN